MDSPLALIKALAERQIINYQAIEFAHFWLGLDTKLTGDELIVFLALIHFQDKGNVALDQDLLDEFLKLSKLKSVIGLTEAIKNSKLVGESGEFKPFIYWEGLLYFQKDFMQEKGLSSWILSRLKSTIEFTSEYKSKIDAVYAADLDNPQKKAIYWSFYKPIQIITGGPGTGKTFTIGEIIKAHKNVFGDSYSIKIAAPTGKAAQRINDALTANEDDAIKGVTIHQLLGATDLLRSFKYNSKNLLVTDLLIIDEASMMDLSLWSALKNAMSETTRLIIVGDPFQLSSVESGSVLSDLYSLLNNIDLNIDELASVIHLLEKRHRFTGESGISKFADAINSMDSEKAFELLKSNEFSDLKWLEISADSITKVLNEYAIEPSLSNDLNHLYNYQIFTALRNGKMSCNLLNKIVEQELKKIHLIPQSTIWFNQRRVMATKNNYQLGIQNGEIGLYDEITDKIFFSSENKVSKNLLSDYESGYCITIHKSQGSEYDHVAIILPDNENSILSKELLYTAVTRAKKSVLVVGSSQILKKSISNKTKRKTGLVRHLNNMLK